MDDWDAIRSAYQVAKQGTVSAAAEHLGLHRATINRHIDLIEEELGEKLFQRHPRGYTPTELGQCLFKAAEKAEECFDRFSLNAKRRREEPSGPLRVICDPHLHFILLEAMSEILRENADIEPEILSVESPLQLECDSAHAALVAGARPNHPDYVVRGICELEFGLYRRSDYNGEPGKSGDRRSSTIIRQKSTAVGDIPDLHAQWLAALDHPIRRVLTCEHSNWVRNAIESGFGAGFLPRLIGDQQSNLVEAAPPRSEWRCDVWLVAHVDVVRSAKVQTLFRHLRLQLTEAEVDAPSPPGDAADRRRTSAS